VLGNVLTRADANESLTETFTYDTLNRVTSATVGQSVAPVKTFSYDAIGNLLSKSDVGNYSYPLAGSALPHAVTSISGGAVSTSFAYDPNGNQTTGLGRSIAYTSYNKPSSITQGSSTLFFSDDTDHQRFRQVSPQGTTLYFTAFGVHTELYTVTGAFGYLFNYLRHIDLPTRGGFHPITVFDSDVADQVLGFFNALRELGVPVTLSGSDKSGFRTTEMQETISTDNPYGRATPGQGPHEAGVAFDINYNA
jgi:hypothetical protein